MKKKEAINEWKAKATLLQPYGELELLAFSGSPLLRSGDLEELCLAASKSHNTINKVSGELDAKVERQWEAEHKHDWLITDWKNLESM